MNDVHGPHAVHSFDKLAEQPEGFEFWQSFIPLDVFSQVSAFTILQEDVEVGRGFLDVDKIDNILMLAFLEERDFSLKIFQLRFFILKISIHLMFCRGMTLTASFCCLRL